MYATMANYVVRSMPILNPPLYYIFYIDYSALPGLMYVKRSKSVVIVHSVYINGMKNLCILLCYIETLPVQKPENHSSQTCG